ncbi:MAG: trigger factor [Treponema sp.]|nr:trigger factor [Treponema sp.]
MNITKEFVDVEKSAVKLTVTIAKEDVAAAYNDTIKKYVKQAQIPGFRKGHVPANILERKFGEGIKADAASDLIDKSLNELFEDESLKDNRPLPYAQPVMEKMPELDVSKDLTYTVIYDIFPKVAVKNIAGITVKEVQVEIGEKEMAEELKAIQERNAVVIDKKDDEPVEKDNIVTVNYCELDENGNVLKDTQREDFVFTVGTGQNIFKIDDDILGMKKGDEREFTKTYGADDSNTDLAGKTKKLRVKVTAIKVRNLPALDDDLAQDVSEKYKTLDDLKADIKKNMEGAKNRRVRELKNNSLLEQLVEKNQFDIPSSMLNAELDARWRMMAQQFQTTPEQLDRMFASSGQTKTDMLKEWSPTSEKMLKSRIIVDTLLRERNIAVTPEEIEKEYERIAAESGSPLEDVKKHYEDARAREYLIDDVKEQKLYDELYKEVKVSKGEKMSFEDLFKNQ